MSHASDLSLTRHAEVRSQQRGIREKVMRVLLTYGNSRVRHDGKVVFMDKRARARARAGIGKTPYAQLERALDAYLVLAHDGTVLTCAHRTKKLKFPKT